MTGEMNYIDPETGKDSNGDMWEAHAAIAKEFGAELKPFDVYQGPYILLHDGEKLWIISDDTRGYIAFQVFREKTEQLSNPFEYGDLEGAVKAAKDLFLSSTLEVKE